MKKICEIIAILCLLSGCSKKIIKEQSKIEVRNVQIQYSEEKPNMIANRTFDVRSCKVTPSVLHEVKVPQIYKTNNLRKRTGYATYANGQFIKIAGVVTDSNCVPISNVTVQMWQADSNGIYKEHNPNGYLHDEVMYRKQIGRFSMSFHKKSDENFTGSGSTVTNNLGRFTFLSVMPGGKEPLIHFRVLHKDFEELYTVMYFSNVGQKSIELIAKKEPNEEQDLVFSHNITLSGKNKYVDY